MFVKDIHKQDMHIHTRCSNCVKEDYGVKEVVNKIKKLGIKEFAITDHYHSDEDSIKQLKEKRADYPKVKIGLEISHKNIIKKIVNEEIIKSCDIIIASIHQIPGSNVRMDTEEVTDDKKTLSKNYLKMLKYLIKVKYVDIMGHPFGLLLKHKLPISEGELLEILNLAKKFNKKIEFSELRFRKVGKKVMLPFYKKLFKLCKKVNCEISLGSDAHTLNDVGNIENIYKIVSGKI